MFTCTLFSLTPMDVKKEKKKTEISDVIIIKEKHEKRKEMK